MKITYKDLVDDLTEVKEKQKRDPLERYSVDIDGVLKIPSAMQTLEALETSDDFKQRAQFVKTLLTGCHITIYKDDKKLFDVGMTSGVEWWAIDGFNQDPFALRYLVTSVYARFLKNFAA